MTESTTQRLIEFAVTARASAARLFRNNVAQGWVGVLVAKVAKRQQVWLQPGDVVLRNARPLHAGLCNGSSDLLGWVSVTVTPDMVGQQVAVFAAVEVKHGRGRATQEQKNFIDVVRAAGGRAGVAYNEDQAINILSGDL